MYIIKKLKRKFAIALAACIVMTNALPVFAEPVFEEDQYAEAVEAAEASEAAKEELLPTTNGEVEEDGTVSALQASGTYTVHFDGHGSSSGFMDDQVMTYDVAARLNQNGFEPPSSKKFAGWALMNTSEEPVYADRQLVKNLVTPSQSEITLYAIWIDTDNRAVIYSIDVEVPEGGSINRKATVWGPSGYPNGCTAAANEGYNFVGWKDADGNFITETTDDVELSNDGKTITPKQASTKDTYYTAVFEKQMTIADMLELSAMAFPTEQKYGWLNNQSQGTRAYISDSSDLKFTPGNGGGSFAYPLTSPLTKTGSGYQYSNLDVAIQFNLDDGVLENIEIPVCNYDDAFVGTYKPEIPTIAIDAARTEYELGETIEFEITTTALQDESEIEVSEGTHTWTKKVYNDQAAFSDSTKDTVGAYTYEVKIPQFEVSAFINITVKKPSQKIDPPTADTHTYTYNGAKQTYSPVGFDPAAMVMENGLQKDAGTYEVKVVPAERYVWKDGTREPVIFTWAISPKYVGGFKWTEPDSKVYDGTPLNIGIGCEDICSGDDCRLNCTIHKDSADGEAVSEAKDPGTYVGVPDNQLSGKAAGNYIVSGSLPEAKTYTITKKEDPKKDDPSSEPDQVFTGTWANPVKSGKWTQDANGIWSYTSTEVFRNTWGYIVNPFAGESQNKADWFYFDQYGHMLTGWQLINGKWYYLNPTKDGTLGACQLGGVTPDGWTVDESGAWIESIPRK